MAHVPVHQSSRCGQGDLACHRVNCVSPFLGIADCPPLIVRSRSSAGCDWRASPSSIRHQLAPVSPSVSRRTSSGEHARSCYRSRVRPSPSAFRVKADQTSDTPRAYRCHVTCVWLPRDLGMTFHRIGQRCRSHSCHALYQASRECAPVSKFNAGMGTLETHRIQVSEVRSPLSDRRPRSSRDSEGATVATLRATTAMLLFRTNGKPTQETATMTAGTQVEFNRLRTSVTYVRFPRGH
jgi:hypothetical protein